MGLDDELRYRHVISVRRVRWDKVCRLSTRLLSDNFVVTSSNNHIILSVISSLYGLKTSPRGSFDRFLLRELNGFEILQDLSLNVSNYDICGDISRVLEYFLSGKDVGLIMDDSCVVSSVLRDNLLFMEVIRSLPVDISLDSNTCFMRHVGLYVFIVGLFVLTRVSFLVDIVVLKRIVQIVYYYTQFDILQSWLKRQLELNYKHLLSDYPINVVKCEDFNDIRCYKEFLIELCQPLIILVYHDMFVRHWHLMTNGIDPCNISNNFKLFYGFSKDSMYVGLRDHDLIHEITLSTFRDLYSRFIHTINGSSTGSSTGSNTGSNTGNDYILDDCDGQSLIVSSYPEFANITTDIFREFIGSLWVLLTRYSTISESCSSGLQSSIPKSVYEFTRKVFGCDIECFSSPLNVQSPYFCSLFPDVDSSFGSSGDFFSCVNSGLMDNHSALIVNPPFDLQILNVTVDVILKLLDRTKALCIVFVGPYWTCDFYNRLSNSIFTKNLIKLKPGSYKYRDLQKIEYRPCHESFCVTLCNPEFEILLRRRNLENLDNHLDNHLDNLDNHLENLGDSGDYSLLFDEFANSWSSSIG